ncbi:hypothetical protein JCM13210_10750 [Thermaerobacter litoralis]
MAGGAMAAGEWRAAPWQRAESRAKGAEGHWRGATGHWKGVKGDGEPGSCKPPGHRDTGGPAPRGRTNRPGRRARTREGARPPGAGRSGCWPWVWSWGLSWPVAAPFPGAATGAGPARRVAVGRRTGCPWW